MSLLPKLRRGRVETHETEERVEEARDVHERGKDLVRLELWELLLVVKELLRFAMQYRGCVNGACTRHKTEWYTHVANPRRPPSPAVGPAFYASRLFIGG